MSTANELRDLVINWYHRTPVQTLNIRPQIPLTGVLRGCVLAFACPGDLSDLIGLTHYGLNDFEHLRTFMLVVAEELDGGAQPNNGPIVEDWAEAWMTESKHYGKQLWFSRTFALEYQDNPIPLYRVSKL
jgi:hypothetical protein